MTHDCILAWLENNGIAVSYTLVKAGTWAVMDSGAHMSKLFTLT